MMKNQLTDTNKSKAGITIWIFFILSPFLTLLYSLKNFRIPFSKNIVWAFTAFYGFTYTTFYEGMDSDRYKQWFLDNVALKLNFSDFLSTLFNYDTTLYTSNQNIKIDFVEPLISYLVSQFTGDYRFLFAVYGLFVGYFYSRNLWYLLDRIDIKAKRIIVPLFVAFALVSPIWELPGIRFFLATHMFLYGALPFIFEGKKNKLVFTVLALSVHFSFFIPVLVLLVYVIFQNRLLIYYIVFIVSLFISEVNAEKINDIFTSYFPEILYARTSGYINPENVEEYREDAYAIANLNWYVKGHEKVLKWLIVVFLTVIYLKGKESIKSQKNLLRLICFTFLIYSFANIAILLPSGGRFYNIANLFALASIILYIQNGPKQTLITKLIPLAIPLLWLFIIVRIRMGFETIGLTTILGNPIIVMFFKGDISLIQLIK